MLLALRLIKRFTSLGLVLVAMAAVVATAVLVVVPQAVKIATANHGTAADLQLTDLAERALITKQTAGFLVDQLERAGYVRRVPDPRDARARLVQIAKRGRAAVEVARQTEAKVEAEWTAHLGEEATTQLRHALVRLRDITDPYR